MLCQLSYRGRQPRDCSRASPRASAGRTGAAGGEDGGMRRFAVVGVAVSIGVLAFAPSGLAGQCSRRRTPGRAPRARARSWSSGRRRGPADPTSHARASSGQRASRATGRSTARRGARWAGGAGRCSGSAQLAVGAVGWDVAVLEFRLRRHGLGARAVDGRFTRRTGIALRRYQRRRGLDPGRDRGPEHLSGARRRSRAPTSWHVVTPGESFFSIAARYHVSPWRLARRNRLSLMTVIVPGQRLALPGGSRLTAPPAAGPPASRDSIRSAIDYWSRVYGVDPQLARALAWMESGFQQDVVSSVGAIGVMQLLPETWEFVDTVLLGSADAAELPGQRPRRGSLPALAARRVRREQAPRARGLVPGRAGGARAGPLRRHEGVRPHRARALRHGLRRLELAERDRDGVPELELAPALDSGDESGIALRREACAPSARHGSLDQLGQALRLLLRRLPRGAPARSRSPRASATLREPGERVESRQAVLLVALRSQCRVAVLLGRRRGRPASSASIDEAIAAALDSHQCPVERRGPSRRACRASVVSLARVGRRPERAVRGG